MKILSFSRTITKKNKMERKDIFTLRNMYTHIQKPGCTNI